jgi:hypothetical protein
MRWSTADRDDPWPFYDRETLSHGGKDYYRQLTFVRRKQDCGHGDVLWFGRWRGRNHVDIVATLRGADCRNTLLAMPRPILEDKLERRARLRMGYKHCAGVRANSTMHSDNDYTTLM